MSPLDVKASGEVDCCVELQFFERLLKDISNEIKVFGQRVQNNEVVPSGKLLPNNREINNLDNVKEVKNKSSPKLEDELIMEYLGGNKSCMRHNVDNINHQPDSGEARIKHNEPKVIHVDREDPKGVKIETFMEALVRESCAHNNFAKLKLCKTLRLPFGIMHSEIKVFRIMFFRKII